MKRYTISQLGKACGLSRSALLYYDRAGLLPAAGRTGANYRWYSEADRRRLERILQYRRAGLGVREIGVLLASGSRAPAARLLEKRMGETSDAIVGLQRQQRLLAALLAGAARQPSRRTVDKQLWVGMLQAAGMNEAAMRRWHAEFERRAPESHKEFLLSLGIPEDETLVIRKWSREE